MNSSSQRKLKGFSLVELLVVVAVIGILGAMIFGVFARAKESAKRGQCASNLKQINLALQMYASDHNRYFPFVSNVAVGQPTKCSWADRLFPYVKQTSTFECPTLENHTYELGCPPDSTMLDEDGIAYNFDGGYDLNRLNRKGHSFVHESSLTHPADTIAALDGKGRMVTPGWEKNLDLQELRLKIKPMRHGQGYNVLFVDGHIKWKSEEALLEQRLWWPQEKPPYGD